MIEFRKPTLEDKEWISERLKESDYRACEYVFGNMFIWRNVSDVEVALVEDVLCIKGKSPEDEIIYNYPAGKGDIHRVIDLLIEHAKELGKKCRFRGVLKEQLGHLKAWYGEDIDATTDPGDWDYVYEVEKMRTLAGKKYHGKRNHIARFKDGDDWSYEPITEENLPECVEMNQIWCETYGCDKGESAKLEQCAVRQSFKYFKELSLEGGLLRKGGRVVAFAIGEPINSDTFGVHIEKAFPDVQGAYPMINQQFVEHNMQGYMYVNREEDMGDEGLRKAKMSYRPELPLEKYVVTFH